MMTGVLVMCGFTALGEISLLIMNFPVEPITTLSYEDHTYHVLEYSRECIDSVSCYTYPVYQCDSTNFQCHLIPARLYSDEDVLWWEFSPQTPELRISDDGQLQMVIDEQIFDIPTE